jgi:hypothetical protein
MAVILLGGIGGALVGYSVGGYVAAERVLMFTAHSPGHVGVSTTAAPNMAATLVAVLFGAAIGSLAGQGMTALFRRGRSPMGEAGTETVQQLKLQCRA